MHFQCMHAYMNHMSVVMPLYFFLRVQDEKLKRNLDNDYPIMMVDLRGSISPLSRLKKRVDIYQTISMCITI